MAREYGGKAMQPNNGPGASGAPTCGDSGGVSVSGKPCASRVLLETGLCAHHDPAFKEEIRIVRAAGGRTTTDIRRLQRRIKDTVAPADLPSFPPDSLERLSRWHQWAVKSVATGEISERNADAICRHLSSLRPTLINLGLEKRVKELEASLKKAKRELGR